MSANAEKIADDGTRCICGVPLITMWRVVHRDVIAMTAVSLTARDSIFKNPRTHLHCNSFRVQCHNVAAINSHAAL
jgi:hypothetical protein